MDKTVNDEFRRLRRIALAFARSKYNDEEFSQEFAQEHCLAVLEGKVDNLIFSYADFCRRRFGRHGQKLLKIEQIAYKTEFPIVEPDVEKKLQIYDMERCIKKVESRQQRIILQLSLYEVPKYLMAEIFLVSPSRISQIFEKALKELKKIYKASL